MEIAELIRAMRRRWQVILTLAAAAAVAGYLNFQSRPPVYGAEAQVRVYTTMVGDTSWTEFNLQYSDRLVNTYVAILSGDAVRQELVEVLQGTFPGLLSEEALPELEVAVLPNTELLSIRAESTDSVLAAAVVNRAAELLVARELPAFASSAVDLPGETPVSRTAITILDRADAATEPLGPSLPVLIALITTAGLISGAVLALFLHAIDPRLHGPGSIVAATGLPLLGNIPRIRGRGRRRPHGPISPVAREALRRLHLHVDDFAQSARAGSDRGVALLVSATQPRDGASTIASHLAVTAAEAGRSVLLIDLNLRLPAAGRFFEVDGLFGITDVLAGKATLDDTIERSQNRNLHILTSGSRAAAGLSLLSGRSFPSMMEQLRDQYDLILVDTAAFPTLTEAAYAAPHVDGVLLVVRCGSTLRTGVSDAIARWELLAAHFVGAVANHAPRSAREVMYQRHYEASRQSIARAAGSIADNDQLDKEVRPRPTFPASFEK